jgi:hypothetical protein
MPMTRDQLLQAHASARVYQERYEQAFQPWGMHAPAPVVGGPVDDCRRNLAVKARRLLPEGHEMREVPFRKLADDVLDRFEPQLIKDCGQAAYRADSVPLGQMRRVEETDSNGHKEVKWIGQQCFVRDMMPPSRLVLGFRTPQGFLNTSGRFLR